jgi:hypothetical protein
MDPEQENCATIPDGALRHMLATLGAVHYAGTSDTDPNRSFYLKLKAEAKRRALELQE